MKCSRSFFLLKIEQGLCLNHRYLVRISSKGVDVQLASPCLKVNITERLQPPQLQFRKFDKDAAISGEAFKVCMTLPVEIRAHLLDLKICHITYAFAQSTFMSAWSAELKSFNQTA